MKTRALKEVVQDPLAKKEFLIPMKKVNPSRNKHFSFMNVLTFLFGLVGGYILSRWLKILF